MNKNKKKRSSARRSTPSSKLGPDSRLHYVNSGCFQRCGLNVNGFLAVLHSELKTKCEELAGVIKTVNQGDFPSAHQFEGWVRYQPEILKCFNGKQCLPGRIGSGFTPELPVLVEHQWKDLDWDYEDLIIPAPVMVEFVKQIQLLLSANSSTNTAFPGLSRKDSETSDTGDIRNEDRSDFNETINQLLHHLAGFGLDNEQVNCRRKLRKDSPKSSNENSKADETLAIEDNRSPVDLSTGSTPEPSVQLPGDTEELDLMCFSPPQSDSMPQIQEIINSINNSVETVFATHPITEPLPSSQPPNVSSSEHMQPHNEPTNAQTAPLNVEPPAVLSQPVLSQAVEIGCTETQPTTNETASVPANGDQPIVQTIAQPIRDQTVEAVASIEALMLIPPSTSSAILRTTVTQADPKSPKDLLATAMKTIECLSLSESSSSGSSSSGSSSSSSSSSDEEDNKKKKSKKRFKKFTSSSTVDSSSAQSDSDVSSDVKKNKKIKKIEKNSKTAQKRQSTPTDNEKNAKRSKPSPIAVDVLSTCGLPPNEPKKIQKKPEVDNSTVSKQSKQTNKVDRSQDPSKRKTSLTPVTAPPRDVDHRPIINGRQQQRKPQADYQRNYSKAAVYRPRGRPPKNDRTTLTWDDVFRKCGVESFDVWSCTDVDKFINWEKKYHHKINDFHINAYRLISTTKKQIAQRGNQLKEEEKERKQKEQQQIEAKRKEEASIREKQRIAGLICSIERDFADEKSLRNLGILRSLIQITPDITYTTVEDIAKNMNFVKQI